MAPDSGAAPFTVGFVFQKGEVPNGQEAACSLPGTQVVIKNRWPDGSAKFALVSGRAALTGGSPLTATFSVSPATASGAALTTADLRATGAAASVGCGGFGTVSWSGADWDAPFLAWVSGPAMSSWIYRKAVGSDAHLVAWLEVRLYAGGAVEVLPWVENGFIRVPAPTNKAATYTFSLGGGERFNAAIDLPHHTRTPLLSGAALAHWLGADPGVVARHDAAYLQATKLVPTYSAVVSPSAAVVAGLPATFTPLQLGNFTASMGNGGYQPAIGLLPEWDVLYLTTTSNAPWSALQRNAYSAGRWAIHYRDENTHRPLRFSQYPNLSLSASTRNDYVPAPTGTAAPGWDVPHHPSIGYMAYLATGRWFHMETVLFAATMNYLRGVDGGPYANRNFAQGLLKSNAGAYTTRGAGWALRTLAQAVTVVPDQDVALQAELVASLEANIGYYHGRFVARANNPFGVVDPYGDAYGSSSDGKVTEAPWQQNFFTAAVGYALAMDPPISSDIKGKLAAFFQWKARSVIGMLGTEASGEWLYRDAGSYTFVIAFVDQPDFETGVGPWPASWGEMYVASFAMLPVPRAAGDLRGGNFPEVSSYWANLQPAISYAVEHSVPGARDAYSRIVSAGNWSLLASGFDAMPVWSVRPRT